MSAVEFFPKIERNSGNAAPSKSSGTQQTKTAKKGATDSAASFSDVMGSAQNDAVSERPRAPEKTSAVEAKTSTSLKSSPSPRQMMTDETRGMERSSDAAPLNRSFNRDVGAVQPGMSAGFESIGASEQMPTPISANDALDITDLALVDVQQDQKAVLKQQAVLDFMSEMQSKFGVSPEQILEAFAKLDEDALNGKPEDAMAQFLAQLQIPKAHLADAEKLYQKMVTATGDSALNERLGDGKKVVNLQVLAPEEMRTLELHSKLDHMSNSFFRRGELTQPGMKDPTAHLGLNGLQQPNTLAQMTEPMANNSERADSAMPMTSKSPSTPTAAAEPNKSKGMSLGLATGAGAALGLAANSALTAATGANAYASTGSGVTGSSAMSGVKPATPNSDSNAFDLSEDGEAFSEMFDSVGAEQGAAFDAIANAGAGGSAVASGATGALGGAIAAGGALGAMSASVSSPAAGAISSQSEGKREESDLKAEGSQTPGVAGAGTAPGVQPKAAPLAPAAMILESPQATIEQKQENINEIIRQAQVIMKRGGGEMKLQLQPEGLGQVNLKVLVQDGQVNVQMMTENDSAKKLLENGLNDLKAQLAAHKLHVETLKVDMQADAGMKKFEQNLNDANREQARQFASDFMGQFRDERQNFFSNFMDRPNLKGYGRAQKRAPVEPTPVDGTTTASQRGRTGDNSRRLNLVA
ncbi:MAG: flagellar hook-length control protein FliK [Bdellovibrionaceae bacterium]|nr:flagellar hook-length control protein FliK [Pseudobdellovibrionaceae bacterium]